MATLFGMLSDHIQEDFSTYLTTAQDLVYYNKIKNHQSVDQSVDSAFKYVIGQLYKIDGKNFIPKQFKDDDGMLHSVDFDIYKKKLGAYRPIVLDVIKAEYMKDAENETERGVIDKYYVFNKFHIEFSLTPFIKNSKVFYRYRKYNGDYVLVTKDGVPYNHDIN